MKTKTFDSRPSIPVLGQMWGAIQLAAKDRMVPADEYIRAASAARLAKDGYLPASE